MELLGPYLLGQSSLPHPKISLCFTGLALVNGLTWQAACYRHLAQTAWVKELTENYTTQLETTQQPKSNRWLDSWWVEMLGKVWLQQLVRRQCPSLRTDSQNMEETRAGRGCRWRLRPVCLPLTACWSFLLLCVCPFNPRTWRQLFSFSSAISLLSDKSRLNHSLCLALWPGKNISLLPEHCYLTPSSVLPGLWRGRIPQRGTQKEILVLKNTEQNCFRPLFLKQTCLLWWFVSVLTVQIFN